MKKFMKFVMNMNSVVLAIVSLALAVLISGVIMALCGYNPFEAFGAILVGAFGGKRAVLQTMTQATPLIFTGLAYSFARKASLINLGIEGQLYVGAMVAAMVGVMDFGMPMAIHLPLALGAGILAGGLFAGLVGFLKVKFGSNEVIATIMLNKVATCLVAYLVNYHFLAEGSGTAQTEKVLETAMLPRLFAKYQLTIAIIIAVGACILVKYFFDKTVVGYEIRAVGQNQLAAETAGIKAGKIMILTMFISGAIGGLAGAAHVLGVDRRLMVGFSPGYGFDGIAVSALAAENPVGVILSGIVFGALRAGSMVLNRTTSIPTEFTNVIQALVVLFVAAPLLVKEILGVNLMKKLEAGKEEVDHE